MTDEALFVLQLLRSRPEGVEQDEIDRCWEWYRTNKALIKLFQRGMLAMYRDEEMCCPKWSATEEGIDAARAKEAADGYSHDAD